MLSAADAFPPLGLRIRAGDLELSGATDADLVELADLAAEGVHDPARMPFLVPWTDVPPQQLRPSFLQYHWRCRADFSPTDWRLDLAVRHRGTLVGLQGLSSLNYQVTRTGETGSWLGVAFQGKGIGTRMRQAFCAFLFDHLDAAEVTSGAFLDNPASLAVSRKVGYRRNGVRRLERRPGELAIEQMLALAPEDLVRGEPIEVSGVAAFRRFIGLDD